MEELKTKILLVEDDPNFGAVLKDYLSMSGYDVRLATDGEKGEDLFFKEEFNLCVLDVMMPKKDGFTLAAQIKRINPEMPVIFLTAKTLQEDVLEGFKVGADDYITKPFSDIELMDAIEMRFKKTELLKKEFSKDIEGLNEFINKVESFDALIKLTGDRKCKSYKKKEIIFSEGSHPGGVYFVNKGKVKTFKSNEDGKEYITGLYKEGEFIGYTAVLEDSNFTESASALEDAEVCLIQRQDFLSLLYSNREVANKFIKLLSDNLVEKEERLLSLAYNSVRKRVAEALLMLRTRYTESNTDDFSIHISREDLSNIVGTATESLIRTLSDFKEEGLIELKAGQVKIIDLRKLEHMKF